MSRCVTHSSIVCAPMRGVEPERELVPVERRPFQAFAAALEQPRGDRGQRAPPTPARAVVGAHVDVLEPDRPGSPGRSRRSGRTPRSRPPAPPPSAISASAAGRAPNSAVVQPLRGAAAADPRGARTRRARGTCSSSTGTSPGSAARTRRCTSAPSPCSSAVRLSLRPVGSWDTRRRSCSARHTARPPPPRSPPRRRRAGRAR